MDVKEGKRDSTMEQADSEPANSMAAGEIPPLVAAMERPEFYPHRPAAVELRQTHVSYIFLAGEYVYKVKKAVRFPFIDCSTLEARRRLCLEEVRLNRRLAPTVYLGVTPILFTEGGFALSDDASRSLAERLINLKRGRQADLIAEYVVKMRRLPHDRMLDRLIGQGLATTADIQTIAQRLAAFHNTAPSEKAARYGSAAAVARIVTQNLSECERFEGHTIKPPQTAALARYSRAFVRDHWQLLNRRARLGRVREGHGDLRCEHICLTDGIVIFDCVEFSEALRYADVACDVAFLAMDLDRLGAADLSRELTAAYARISRDSDFASLLPFYKCYRAVVRGKVESLRSLEPEVPAAERERAAGAARDYFRLACRYAVCYDGRPALIAVCGAAGTGKSTVAKALGRRLGFEVVSSDETRKRIAGVAPTTSLKAPYGGGIYGEEFSRRTYAELLESAQTRISAGNGIILDATYRHPSERGALIESARRAGVPVMFVECRAEEEEVMRRMRERARQRESVSDADAAVYLRQRADFTPLDEIAPQCRCVADTTRALEEIVAMVEERLANLCGSEENRA